jgi:hypothetical protein
MATKQQPPTPPRAQPAIEAAALDAFTFAAARDEFLISLYLAMADALTSAKHHLNVLKLEPEIYEQILPEQILNLAASRRLIPTLDDAAEGAAVQVGSCFIDPLVRDGVLRSLGSAISWVRDTENDPDRRWKHPTPREHVDRFLKIKTARKPRIWKQVDLIKALSKTDFTKLAAVALVEELTREYADKKFLQKWIYRDFETYLNVIPDDRTYKRLTNLLEIMQYYAPLEFSSLTVDALCWRSPYDMS